MAKNARKKKPRSGERDDSPGLAVRRVAADIVEGVLNRHRALDEMLEGSDARAATAALAAMADRDRGLTRAIVAVVLRRLGTLRHLLGSFLEEGLPAQAPRVETVLLIGAAQILFLEVPDHAAVDLAVRLAREDFNALHFTGLINAVLRRIAREGTERIAALDAPVLDTPPWLMARWIKTYGEATAHAIAAANGREPALDLTVKSDAEAWAAKLDGRVLPTGSVRTIVHGAVTALPGFDEGAWWVQDAAASIPARLLGNVSGLRVADLCAAPGGKTAQLVAAGAKVTAVDRAPARLKRLQENLTRLSLEAELVCADVGGVDSGATIRRRPARCAVHVDRHHPPPSRRAVAQARSRHRVARRGAAPLARSRDHADQTRRHSWCTARARSNLKKAPTWLPICWRANQACGACRSPSRKFLAKPTSSTTTAICARYRAILPMLIRATPASMVSTRRGLKSYRISMI